MYGYSFHGMRGRGGAMDKYRFYFAWVDNREWALRDRHLVYESRGNIVNRGNGNSNLLILIALKPLLLPMTTLLLISLTFLVILREQACRFLGIRILDIGLFLIYIMVILRIVVMETAKFIQT